MISRYNYDADAIDNKESIVNIIDLLEIIYTSKFKLESMVAPEAHETNLSKVDHQALNWAGMNDSVIDHHEWH